jgi:hypothetical protein
VLFAFLHRPPELDFLELSLDDVENMDEDTAFGLLDKLREQQERTIDARKAAARK